MNDDIDKFVDKILHITKKLTTTVDDSDESQPPNAFETPEPHFFDCPESFSIHYNKTAADRRILSAFPFF